MPSWPASGPTRASVADLRVVVPWHTGVILASLVFSQWILMYSATGLCSKVEVVTRRGFVPTATVAVSKLNFLELDPGELVWC